MQKNLRFLQKNLKVADFLLKSVKFLLNFPCLSLVSSSEVSFRAADSLPSCKDNLWSYVGKAWG